MVQSCETIPPLANSDHLGIHLIMSTKLKKNPLKPQLRNVWRYNLADFNQAVELLDSVEWEALLDESDVDVYWSSFKHYFLQIMEICIPHALVKTKRNIPWFNKEIKQAIRKRNQLHRQAKVIRSAESEAKFRAMRNKVVSLLRESKLAFFGKLNQANNKEFWKIMKFFNNTTSTIPTLQTSGTVAHSSVDKANALNNFFYGCYNQNCPPLTQCSHNYEQEMPPEHCPEQLLSTEASVFDLLAQLDTTKSTGCDGISARMLKQTADSTAPILSKLINMSISKGKFPREWKTARVVPIPKPGSEKDIAAGYRPISILPIASKIIERHVKAVLEEHLKKHAPISPRQWGFMADRSTMSALIQVVDDWARALDHGYEVCVIFFDVRKAFDSVPHLPLLDQLQAINVNPYLQKWISNYLSDRSQFVTVEGEASDRLPVVSGVPQGSVLGPLLFVMYINDVATTISQGSMINMFADDIAYYRIIQSQSDYAIVQKDVDYISSFMSCKLLDFNANKCRVMLLSRRRANSVPSPPIYLNGVVLSRVTTYKYLGVIISHNLSWKPHNNNIIITTICNKTRRLIGMIYRKFHGYSNPVTLLKLYLTIIYYLDQIWNMHAFSVWDPSQNYRLMHWKACTNSV